MKYSPDNLPAKILQYRIAKGMTQEDFAKLTGLHVTAVSHFESGERRPSLPNFVLLANKMKVSTDWLLT